MSFYHPNGVQEKPTFHSVPRNTQTVSQQCRAVEDALFFLFSNFWGVDLCVHMYLYPQIPLCFRCRLDWVMKELSAAKRKEKKHLQSFTTVSAIVVFHLDHHLRHVGSNLNNSNITTESPRTINGMFWCTLI